MFRLFDVLEFDLETLPESSMSVCVCLCFLFKLLDLSGILTSFGSSGIFGISVVLRILRVLD